MSAWKRSNNGNTFRKWGDLRPVIMSDRNCPDNDQLGVYSLSIYCDGKFCTLAEAKQFADNVLDALEQVGLTFIGDD